MAGDQLIQAGFSLAVLLQAVVPAGFILYRWLDSGLLHMWSFWVQQLFGKSIAHGDGRRVKGKPNCAPRAQNLLTPHGLKPVKSVNGQGILLCLVGGPEKLQSHWNKGQMTGRQ